MIAIIDYDAGNIKSVEKAAEHLGQKAVITRDKEVILGSDHIILPGVGAFGDAMDKLRKYNLEPVIRKAVEDGIPFLGICLGLQLIFESSEESPGVKGLGLLPGKIIRIPDEPGLKIPHMGWNSIRICHKKKGTRSDIRSDHGFDPSASAAGEPKEGGRQSIFEGVPDKSYVYFVHSYYLKAENEDDVAATTEYGTTCIHAAVEHGNIHACQFHPEKSSSVGLRILKNFIG